MTSEGALIEAIINSTDPQFLTSLISDELFINYRLYTKPSVVTSTFDYTTLSTKVAYDAFTNSSTTTVSGNIQTETVRVKSIITYAKQYTVGYDGVRNYSYRIITEDTPIVTTANATSTASPSAFVNDVQTVEQTFTLNVLKTSVTTTFIAYTRDDFLTMPSIFVQPSINFTPPSSTYYSLKVMLINYYGVSVSVATTMLGSSLIAIAMILGSAALMLNFTWPAFAIFLSIVTLPIILAFFNYHGAESYTQLLYQIEKQGIFNNYLILSGMLGTIIGGIRLLYRIINV